MLSQRWVVFQDLYIDNLSLIVENKKVDKSQEKYKGWAVDPKNTWEETLILPNNQRKGNLVLKRGAICDGDAPQ